MRRAVLAVGGAVAGAALMTIPYVLSGVASLISAPSDLSLGNVACAAVNTSLDKGLNLSTEQQTNATVIIGVGVEMGIPIRGQVVAIATALQESGLRNIEHGDRDSLGLFQQRPSQGWGTRAQIMDPKYSSGQFYSHLLKSKGWERKTINDAAQTVQRSGFPNAYAQHESRAVQIVASASTQGVQQINAGSGCTPMTSPASTDTAGYVSYALDQVGKPYVWGGTGPDGFDCSGLIVYAWRQMGYQLKIRTSQQMHSVAVPVESGQERSGDLIFSRFEAGGPAHVLIVVRPGVAVEAPRTGLDVRVRPYDAQREGMKFGRLPSSQMTAISAQA
ncbi:C40 family peptidase [Streptomyces sp. NPDC057966]|uniref:C40 family peptidase n=1 Tax=Streptomyces sp. NPDC057966 TaxID=3346292 RepID=UPI0036E28EB2